jgi:hypothetical protein
MVANASITPVSIQTPARLKVKFKVKLKVKFKVKFKVHKICSDIIKNTVEHTYPNGSRVLHGVDALLSIKSL